jgi:MFS family permease
MRIRFDGLWQHKDFLRLWTGQTISVFGSMIGGTALSFTAILFLQATPFQLGLLNAMEIAPALLAGLFAGAWVDRMRRRPLMIGADLGRALALATIPLAVAFGALHMEQVILVALATSVLGILFDLAYQSYLPGLVGQDNLVDGNSKLAASAAVAEFGGFSLGGWLVQIFGPPMSVLIDAGSFVVSALSLSTIRRKEEVPRLSVMGTRQQAEPGDQDISPEGPNNLRREILDGLHTVYRHPLLRASAAVILLQSLSQGMYGALVVLYMVRGLGFEAGILGMIWAVGGISSLVAAAFAPRITRRLGVGRVMIGGLAVSGLSAFMIPFASGATLVSAVLLILAQLGDGFYVIYEINLVSLRQKVADERMLGRVNATMRIAALAAALVGTLLGGVLGGLLGVRPVLFVGALGTMLAAGMLALSPIRSS